MTDFFCTPCSFSAAQAAHGKDLAEGVAAKTVCAMDACADFTRGKKPGEGGFGVGVDTDSPHAEMGRGGNDKRFCVCRPAERKQITQLVDPVFGDRADVHDHAAIDIPTLHDLGYDFEVLVFDQSGRGYKVRDLPFVRMLDGSNREKYLKALSRCHVIMSHTNWDLFSRAYADCLLLEMPLIAPKKCAFPFMCPPGYKYFAETADEALGLLKHFYEHRDQARKVGRECREWVRKNFSVGMVAGWWRETTEALVRKDREAVLRQCSRKRRDAILATAEKVSAKNGGRFTKMEFEKAFKGLHGFGTMGCIRGNSLKTRAVLLANGFNDDFSKEQPTYVKA